MFLLQSSRSRFASSSARWSRSIQTATIGTRSGHTSESAYDDFNAFVSLSTVAEGEPGPSRGKLENTKIAVKDNICTADLPTTCSSAFLKEFRPPYDATVVTLLRNSGGQIVGKTNCDEFGMGSFNTNSVHGPVRNPFQPEDVGTESSSSPRSAGGSSGGSAAAVAGDLCYA
ncbi:Trimeric GatFAB AmidoTransferase(AdT) complex subunit, partial [Tulasnella sp. 417]